MEEELDDGRSHGGFEGSVAVVGVNSTVVAAASSSETEESRGYRDDGGGGVQ